MVAILDFLNGSTHDFGQKLQISSPFVLGKNRRWGSVWRLSSWKQVVLDYKILILNSGHIGFSQRGQPMILVKKWKFYICMFLDKWALKYCLMIIEVEIKPS